MTKAITMLDSSLMKLKELYRNGGEAQVWGDGSLMNYLLEKQVDLSFDLQHPHIQPCAVETCNPTVREVATDRSQKLVIHKVYPISELAQRETLSQNKWGERKNDTHSRPLASTNMDMYTDLIHKGTHTNSGKSL